jgi:hypothetical protein
LSAKSRILNNTFINPGNHQFTQSEAATMTIAMTPLISLIAGILILLMPKLLNYIVAGYLILIGITGLLNSSGINLSL